MNIRRTKIVATIGPSTSSKSTIGKMISAGMNVARINMSHHSDDFDIFSMVKSIRKAAKDLDKSVSIIMDLPGPKIRTANKEIINIKRGDEYTLGLDGDIPINLNLKFNKLGIPCINNYRINKLCNLQTGSRRRMPHYNAIHFHYLNILNCISKCFAFI